MLRGKEVFVIPHDSETALNGWGNECLTRWPTAAALGFTTLWIFYTQHNKPLALLHFAQQTIWRRIWSLLCFIEPAQPISTKSRGKNSARQAGELVNPGFHHPHYHYNTCGLCWLLFKLFSYSCVFFNGILLLPWWLVEASRGSATTISSIDTGPTESDIMANRSLKIATVLDPTRFIDHGRNKAMLFTSTPFI